MDVSQLPQEVQDALPQRNDYSGANNGPVTPGTNLPLPPNVAQNTQAAQGPVAPPDIAPSNAPGSLADKISKAFLEHISSRQPLPPANSEAGQRAASTAQRIAGAADNVMSSLGDAAHAGDRPGGWLSGVSNVINARNQRIAGEKQQQFENSEQKRKDDALIAKNQVETVQLVRNIYNQDKQLRDGSYAQGKAFVDSLRGDHAVTDNVSQDELTNMVQKNPGYLQSHYVRPVGEEPVLDGSGNQKTDANGNPVFSPTYSLVDRNPSHGGPNVHKVTPEEAAYFKTNLGTEYPVDTPLTIDQYAALSGQAHKVADTTRMINADRETALTDAQRSQLRTDLADENVQHYVAMVPGSALGGLYAASKNADDHIASTQKQIQAAQQKGDQNAVQQLQEQLKNFQDESAKVNRVITNGFSDKDRDEYQKNIEKERHDQREEQIQNRRADVQAQKETEQKGLGDSYKTENKEFDTIRKPLSTSLDAFSTLRNSLDQGTAAGDSVVAPALLKALVAGGGVRITQAEINNFTHGRSTVEDMKGVLQKMTSGKSITPEQRKQVYSLLGAVESKVRAKNDILNDAQDSLDNAQSVADQRKAVSDARRKLDAVDSGQQAQKNVQPPAGATNLVYGSDGKTLIGHVVNGKYVALGAQ